MTANPGQRIKANIPNVTKNDNQEYKANKRRFLNTQQNFHSTNTGLTDTERNAHTSSQKQVDQITQDIGGMLNLDPNRTVLLKTGKMLSVGYFLIEISK